VDVFVDVFVDAAIAPSVFYAGPPQSREHDPMSTPFLAEIRLFSFDFPPRGWALCNGQLLPIAQNQALFALLGTTYGGDGRATFGLPDLRGRTPLHVGTIPLGTKAGSERVALNAAQIPAHDHAVAASADVAVSTDPTGAALAKKPRFGADVYAAPAQLTPLAPSSVSTTGGGQGHENMQPFLVVTFSIALQGIFPSRN
jgi:microcystin-dependent protein